ncbi:MAG: hypothetical protein ACXWLR_05580 [Myxococcales bacterium]
MHGKAPDWLDRYSAGLTLLDSGTSYLHVLRDPADCTRTVEIVGAEGQRCASLVLPDSAGCAAQERINGDGTVVLNDLHSCSVRWWPLLGRVAR